MSAGSNLATAMLLVRNQRRREKASSGFGSSSSSSRSSSSRRGPEPESESARDFRITQAAKIDLPHVGYIEKFAEGEGLTIPTTPNALPEVNESLYGAVQVAHGFDDSIDVTADQRAVALQHLRDVNAWLTKHGDTPDMTARAR
ncbi:MAG: hypothetical protein AAF213_13480, partial [Pseudomonadota bacterium]